MPALALVKAGISMPSHSLRIVGATPTEGTKVVSDLGHSCAQANPNAGRNFALHFSETVADFSRKRGGFLGEKLTDCWADYSVRSAEICPNEG